MSVSVQYMRLVRMLRMLRLLKVLKIFNVLRDLFRSAQTHLIDSFLTNFFEGGFRSPWLRDFGKNGVKIIQETHSKIVLWWSCAWTPLRYTSREFPDIITIMIISCEVGHAPESSEIDVVTYTFSLN